MTASEDRAQGGPYRSRSYPRSAVWAVHRLRALRRPSPRLQRYRPVSNLVVDTTEVTAARFPAIDFHTHLGRWLTPDGSWMAPDVGALITLMNTCNVETLVNLDGRWGGELERNLERYDRLHPERFATFCHVDWDQFASDGRVDNLVKSLERSARAGARGLKVWKDLGLRIRIDGQLLLPDDRRLEPVWTAAGALGLPVLIHVGDPLAYFDPVDHTNERFEELTRYPGASLAAQGRPQFNRLIGALETLVARHRATTFIGAHVGCYPENLGWVSTMMSQFPNFYVDIAGRAPELGRQPRAAHRLVSEHPDRVLFGTDAFPLKKSDLQLYFRLLESDDEYFPYSTDDVPLNGRWSISGLDLSDDLLEKVYRTNAKRLLTQPESRSTYFPSTSTL